MGIEVGLNNNWRLSINGQEVLAVMVDKTEKTSTGLAAWVATDAGNYLFEMDNSFYEGYKTGFESDDLAVSFCVNWESLISFERYNF